MTLKCTGSACIVPKIGAPVQILRLAETIYSIVGARLDVRIVGLRPGDNLNEVMIGPRERPQPIAPKSLWQIALKQLDPRAVLELTKMRAVGDLVVGMRELALSEDSDTKATAWA